MLRRLAVDGRRLQVVGRRLIGVDGHLSRFESAGAVHVAVLVGARRVEAAEVVAADEWSGAGGRRVPFVGGRRRNGRR